MTSEADYMDLFDRKSSSQPHNLDIDGDSLSSLLSLGNSDLYHDIFFPKYFSQIKNLQLKNIFCDNSTLSLGWDLMFMASQSLTTLHFPTGGDPPFNTDRLGELEVVPFDLGRFPSLRHFKAQIQIWFGNDAAIYSGLIHLLSVSSSTSRIETLEIIITWTNRERGCEEDLFSSDTAWSTLDEVLSSEKFVSLQKVVLRLGLEEERVSIDRYSWMNVDLIRSPILLHYATTLFPTFRALTIARPTLELHLETL